MGTHLAAVTHTSGREGERVTDLTPDHLGCPGDRCHGNPQEDSPVPESNLCLYKEGDIRPRDGKAMGRPELEQTMCCCIVPCPSEEALLLTLLSKGGN